MKYSVCLSAVFRGLPLLEAMERAAGAGATAYEFWAWWGEDVPALRDKQEALGLAPAACCTRFIPMNQPDRRADFLRGLEESIAAASLLRCPVLIAQTGQNLAHVSRARQEKDIAKTLKEAAALLSGGGVTLAIEPLNTAIDHKGYFLEKAQDAFRLAGEAASPHIRVLYDLYHQHITEGSREADILENLGLIAHFHLAGYPGRHEPWEHSELPWQALVQAIDQAGYKGYLGLEYFPRSAAAAGTGLAGFLRGQRG